jgi:hypothetical protein
MIIEETKIMHININIQMNEIEIETTIKDWDTLIINGPIKFILEIKIVDYSIKKFTILKVNMCHKIELKIISHKEIFLSIHKRHIQIFKV